MGTPEEQQRFLNLCVHGDLKSIQQLLTKDPLLIKSRDDKGRLKFKFTSLIVIRIFSAVRLKIIIQVSLVPFVIDTVNIN